MATPKTSSNDKQRAKILVVDDDHDVAITLKAILEEEEESSKEFEVVVFNDLNWPCQILRQAGMICYYLIF
jgi:CheY-like chemotaxis protein